MPRAPWQAELLMNTAETTNRAIWRSTRKRAALEKDAISKLSLPLMSLRSVCPAVVLLAKALTYL
jgi:hypothetical protein